MADPEILAINAKYVRGDNRRRKRKKVAKVSTPLPEGVVALFTDEAQQKYLAQSNSMEVDEASSSDPPTPVTPALEPQPGPSGRGNQIDSEEEVESASDDDDEDFDNLVFVFDEDDDDNGCTMFYLQNFYLLTLYLKKFIFFFFSQTLI